MKIKIWTLKYNPFVMGGPVWKPVYTEVEAQGKYDLGKGFSGYLIVAPDGRTFVTESQSGGIVGDTITSVQKDIKECEDINFMERQIKEAIEVFKNAEEIPEEEFWKLKFKSSRE